MFTKKYITIEYVRKDGQERTFSRVEAKPIKKSKTHNTYLVHKKDGRTVTRTLIKKGIKSTKRVK